MNTIKYKKTILAFHLVSKVLVQSVVPFCIFFFTALYDTFIMKEGLGINILIQSCHINGLLVKSPSFLLISLIEYEHSQNISNVNKVLL